MTLIAVWMVFRESRILSQKSDNEVKRRGMLGFASKAESCNLIYLRLPPLQLKMPVTPCT